MAFTPEQEAALLNLIAQPAKIISDLESEVSLNGDELIPVEDGSGTFGATVNDIADYTIDQIPAATESVAGIAEIATQAETIAGTASKIVDPAKLLALFGTSDRSPNGYVRLPVKIGGAFVEIILQWGATASISPASGVNVILPITFPNAIIRAFATSNSSGNNNAGYSVSTNSLTTSGFAITNNSSTSGAVLSSWFAIGY